MSKRKKSSRLARTAKWLVLLMVLGAIVAVGLKFAKKSKAKTPNGRVVVVKRQDLTMAVDEIGNIRPFRRIDIKSKVAGQVSEVLVDIGDHVKKGQVLVKLDPRDIEHQLAVTQAQASVDRAALARLQQTLQIKKRAHDKGVLSDLEFVAAQGEVNQRRAQVRVAGARAVVLRDQLGYTQLRSPIDGVVLERNIQPGEMVTPGVSSLVNGKPLLVIAQVAKMLVRTEMNQIDVARVHQGDKATITVNALPGKKFEGTVYRIAAMASKSELRNDSSLRVFPVDILIDTTQHGARALRAGMMTQVHVIVGTKKQALVVPLEAVVRAKGKIQLRKLGEGGKEQLTDVVVGYENDEVSEILSGVDEGDKVRIRPAEANESK